MHANDNIVIGRLYLTGEPVKLTLEGGLVRDVKHAGPAVDTNLIIAPGLTDLQVNGYAGLDLNSDPLLPETVREISVRLWSEGVTTFFPTIITNSSENILRFVSVIADAAGREHILQNISCRRNGISSANGRRRAAG